MKIMAKYSLRDAKCSEDYEELARISHNLRYYAKIWKAHFGADNLRNLQKWENKMDAFLKDNVDYTDISDLEPEFNAVKGNWAYNTTFER